MGHNQGTTPPHPKNQESNSNSEIAKEALKSLKTQTEALKNLCTYLLTICALISLKDGLFSELPPSFIYYYSEYSSGYNFNFHMHFNQKTARPAKNRNRNQAKYKSFISKWRYIKFTLIKALRKDHPEHPRQIHAQEGKNKNPCRHSKTCNPDRKLRNSTYTTNKLRVHNIGNQSSYTQAYIRTYSYNFTYSLLLRHMHINH